jgi:hypothetical protein
VGATEARIHWLTLSTWSVWVLKAAEPPAWPIAAVMAIKGV